MQLVNKDQEEDVRNHFGGLDAIADFVISRAVVRLVSVNAWNKQ